MSLIDTLDYFIKSLEADLEEISWEVRESTNYEVGDWDYYTDRYDMTEQQLNHLKEIKTIVKAHHGS